MVRPRPREQPLDGLTPDARKALAPRKGGQGLSVIQER